MPKIGVGGAHRTKKLRCLILTVQWKDLHQLRFSCLLQIRSFSCSLLLLLLSYENSINFNSFFFIFWLSHITKGKVIFNHYRLSTLETTISFYKGKALMFIRDLHRKLCLYVLSRNYLQVWHHQLFYVTSKTIDCGLYINFCCNIWLMSFCFMAK